MSGWAGLVAFIRGCQQQQLWGMSFQCSDEVQRAEDIHFKGLGWLALCNWQQGLCSQMNHHLPALFLANFIERLAIANIHHPLLSNWTAAVQQRGGSSTDRPSTMAPIWVNTSVSQVPINPV